MNAPANIVYPIDGVTYPIQNPAAGNLDSAYISLSFSATRGGGPHTVEWSVDGNPLGQCKFYDEMSGQQVTKLAGGNHEFVVTTSYGASESVRFRVGN